MNGFNKLFKKVQMSESYISMAVGLVVVVIIAIMAFNYLSQQRERISLPGIQAPDIKDSQEQTTLPLKPANAKTHTVMAGENLWTIALKYYDSGYNWVTLMKANKVVNPDVIFVGQVLEVPQAAVIKPVASGIGPAITTATYTIEKGDSLWKIALRAYGDGYAWTKLAQANGITNPNLIYAGNILKLPR